MTGILRDNFDRTEALIEQFSTEQKPKGLKEALYGYLHATASGHKPSELETQAVLHFIALSLEGIAPSVRMDKTKRKYFCADLAMFVEMACKKGPTGEAIGNVSDVFNLQGEGARKKFERSGVLDAKITINIKGNVGSLDDKSGDLKKESQEPVPEDKSSKN